MEKLTLILCLFLAAVGLSRSQDGCPEIKTGISGSCAESCTSDSDCGRGQKCCNNGCGHQCTACVTANCTEPSCHVAKDKNGCEYCQCDDVKPGCESVDCPAGQHCVMLEVQCVRAPCPPVPQCIGKPQCRPVKCSPDCAPQKGPDGCEYCDCGPPCKYCRPDQECEIFYPPCAGPPCAPPVGVCKDKCAPVSCSPPCKIRKDPDGCDFCDCGDPCEKCTKDQECELQYLPCDQSDCRPPIAICKDKRKCRPVKCSPDCAPQKGPDGCEYCDCGPPCKHCRPDQECEIFYPPCAGPPCAPPVGVCKDKCAPVSCSPPCKIRKDPDGCDFCDCGDPCEKCTKDQECELQYLPCDQSDCRPPIAICKDKRKCPPARCTPDCPPQLDSKGCVYCDCKDPCEHCREDQECEIVYPPCDILPCGPPAGICKDKPKCPLVRCTPECPPHKGPDGCPFCDCTDPCQDCTPGQMCEVLYPTCLEPPCLPPIGVCKDPPAPPTDKRCTARPRLRHCFFLFSYKYIYDVHFGRCRRLRGFTCSAGQNKFRTMKECEEACQAKPAGGSTAVKPPIMPGLGKMAPPVGGRTTAIG